MAEILPRGFVRKTSAPSPPPEPALAQDAADWSDVASTIDISMLLQYCRLPQYHDAFIDSGWDDVPYLLSLSSEQLEEVTMSVGMKPGHAQKFVDLLATFDHTRPQLLALPAPKPGGGGGSTATHPSPLPVETSMKTCAGSPAQTHARARAHARLTCTPTSTR